MTPTAEQKQFLTFAEVEAAGLEDWRQFFEALRTRFRTGGFNQGLELVTRIAALADEADHHPDVDLRYPHVNVSISSHDVFGVTSRDVDLARAISAAAAELGIEADPTATAVVEMELAAFGVESVRLAEQDGRVLLPAEHRSQGLRDLAR